VQNFTLGNQQMRMLEQGSGRVEQRETIQLLRTSATQQSYSNAQIDTTTELMDQAPRRLTIEAAFSHGIEELRGTAGFGFWNAPFAPGSSRLRFPKTAWFFFGSPPLNLSLAAGVPGSGLKAATMDATHPLFFALLPTAPIGFLLMRVPALYRRLWPIGQRAIKVSETGLNLDITKPHQYQLDWLPKQVVFSIDGEILHRSSHSPTGKMGFVAWIDNQYAVVTPQGNFGWGLVEEPNPQWIDIFDLKIEAL
jgi:hypothetical protein